MRSRSRETAIHSINNARLLGLDFGDWTMLLAGLALTASLALVGSFAI